jgi:hypothetical protein
MFAAADSYGKLGVGCTGSATFGKFRDRAAQVKVRSFRIEPLRARRRWLRMCGHRAGGGDRAQGREHSKAAGR